MNEALYLLIETIILKPIFTKYIYHSEDISDSGCVESLQCFGLRCREVEIKHYYYNTFVPLAPWPH